MQSFRERCVEVSGDLSRERVDTLQVNLGKLCNQACRHCHVEAGPRRTEIMSGETAERIMDWLAATDIPALDLTGGAPELAPCFRGMVERAVALGRQVIVRHNFTVQQETGQDDLPDFFARHGARVIGSLPCYLEQNVDQQRGSGAYAGSLAGLRALNTVGYGRPDSGLALDLVYNPLGPSLPPDQVTLREAYAVHLRETYGIVFNQLLTITNVAINRFRGQLERDGRLADYERLLRDRFNPATVPHVMCRNMISVDWLGYVYDCDFNQMLGLRLGNGSSRKLWSLRAAELLGEILTGPHCFACTAGCGSSCGGALAV